MLTRWPSIAPELLSLLRIITAILFIPVGSMKLYSFPMAMPAGVTAPVGSLVWFAGVLEVYGGGLLLVGLFTRPIAFLLSGEMSVAYFYGHARQGIWPLVNGGTDAIFYCFLFLYFSAAGPGPWSLDALTQRRRRGALEARML